MSLIIRIQNKPEAALFDDCSNMIHGPCSLFTESIQKGEFLVTEELKYSQKSNILHIPHSRKNQFCLLFLKHSSDPTQIFNSSSEWLNLAYIPTIVLFLQTL